MKHLNYAAITLSNRKTVAGQFKNVSELIPNGEKAAMRDHAIANLAIDVNNNVVPDIIVLFDDEGKHFQTLFKGHNYVGRTLDLDDAIGEIKYRAEQLDDADDILDALLHIAGGTGKTNIIQGQSVIAWDKNGIRDED